MDAEIAVSRLHRVFEFGKGEGLVRGQRADDSEPQTFVNQAIDLAGTVRRAAGNAARLLLFTVTFVRFALERCLPSHRTSLR